MDLLQLVKHEIKGIDPNAEVILFGSRARGDFREDSDWDFLILLNRTLDRPIKELI
ncbi:MAG: nucleotidyltransferase domain-containing protein [Saprospiraceae bacterium]|uniref:Nucleotidyltransferase domain-containing protein n=1 Tax=Candidatus Opimibacter skivensis TaxID=2982028 RepID=A0A9D7SS75_9BACT|nr:nucleotidyltransferase domain-containing protein [Candidatus Opimibacter skivensis]